MTRLLLAGLGLAAIVGIVLVARRSQLVRRAAHLVVDHATLAMCSAYVVWWGLSTPVRKLLTSTAAGASLGAAAYFVVEIVASFWGHRLAGDNVPLTVRLALIALGGWLLVARWREWKRAYERSVFTSNLRNLMHQVSSLDFSNPTTRASVFVEFVDKVLVGFQAVFAERVNANLNVMEPDPANPDVLGISHLYPKNVEYQPGFRLSNGSGAAGAAFASGRLVYVPNIKYRHGITVQLPGGFDKDGTPTTRIDYDIAPSVYRPVAIEPYQCVLSVPICPNVGARGVLNLDSMTTNAFGREQDLEIADVAAAILAMALSRYRLALLKTETVVPTSPLRPSEDHPAAV